MFPSSINSNQTDSASHPGAIKATGSNQSNPSHLSKAVRKDPAVFPLAFIIGGVILVAGYFVLQKAPKEGGGAESVGPRRPPNPLPGKSASSFVPHPSLSSFAGSATTLGYPLPFTKYFMGQK